MESMHRDKHGIRKVEQASSTTLKLYRLVERVANGPHLRTYPKVTAHAPFITRKAASTPYTSQRYSLSLSVPAQFLIPGLQPPTP